MTLEKPSDLGKGINAKSNEKGRKDFLRQQCENLTPDQKRDYVKVRMDNKKLIDFLKDEEYEFFLSGRTKLFKDQKETLSLELYYRAKYIKQYQKELNIEEELNKIREEPRYKQAYGNEASSSQQHNKREELDPNNENKKPIDFLTPEERKNYESGDEKSMKKKLAERIFHFAELMKTLSRTDSEIERFLNEEIRHPSALYEEFYRNGASSSQQQREIIELSDSEEDGENLPKQKQSSESRSHEGEKRRSDQAQEDTSPSKGQRIDSTTSQYQLYEQQQSKGKELDPMEAHSKTGPSDHLRPLDQVGQGQATLTEQHEVHDQADPTRQAYASSYSDHLGVGLDVEFGYLEFRDGEVEELNKEIEKCKVYQEQKNREIEKKKAKIEKIYHNNNNLISEHTEKITNDLLSEYREKITNDLLSEYRERIKNDLSSEYTEKITNDLLSEYREKIKNDLLSGHNKNLINNLFSKHT